MFDDTLKLPALWAAVTLVIGVALFIMGRDLLSAQPDVMWPVIFGIVSSLVADLVVLGVQRRRRVSNHA